LDPFNIQAGWFVLNFDNLHVETGSGLQPDVLDAVNRTIAVLRLNSDDWLVQLRFTVVREYAVGDLSFDYLRRRYPFIASELQRQNLTEAIKSHFTD
jgi:hypothetical protein